MDNGNVNGKFSIPYHASTMADFDALPPHIRKILRDAPYSISASAVLEQIKAGSGLYGIEYAIHLTMKESTRLTYGPDHPQAK